ncbi:hypothetical protein ACQJBY_027084 [Aegilops geniculata]
MNLLSSLLVMAGRLNLSKGTTYNQTKSLSCSYPVPLPLCTADMWILVYHMKQVHGTPFDIDLSEGEFDEYDEKGECPVALSKLQSTFKVVKKQGFHGKTRYV